jgi:hypothetical protein
LVDYEHEHEHEHEREHDKIRALKFLRFLVLVLNEMVLVLVIEKRRIARGSFSSRKHKGGSAGTKGSAGTLVEHEHDYDYEHEHER